MESSTKDAFRRPSGILKNANEVTESQEHHLSHQHSHDHVHFDEAVIQEHDKDRGTRQKIDDPKTPYHEDHGESFEDTVEGTQNQEDVTMQDASSGGTRQMDEEEVKQHLLEAERNKVLNAQLHIEKQNAFNTELSERLDQHAEQQEDDLKKHQQFQQKRKEHYKGEANAALLLKNKDLINEEDDDDSNTTEQV